MTDDLETRLRAAVHAEARSVDAADPTGASEDASLPAIRRRVRTVRRRRRALAAAAAVAVVAIAVAALPRLGDDRSDVDTIGPAGQDMTTTPDRPTSSEAPATSTTAPPNTTASTAAPGSDGETATPGGDPDVVGDGYQPLWPFPTRAAAEEWQSAHASGGQQPWHLDAEETALSFTTGFLGFTELDTITSSDIGATEAEIGVGYANPDGGGTSTAAVVHLLRWGTGDDAPWEVVGTRDTTLVLERPDYGTTARSPMTVGGYVTGVDESLLVKVLQPSSPAPLGQTPDGLPAGGTDTPWETTVSFSGATDPAVTVVVWTGGHVQGVERFAVTGLRTPTG